MILKKGIEMCFPNKDKNDGKFFCNFILNEKQREIYQLPSGLKHQIALRSIMCEHYEHIFLVDEPENSLYPHEQEELIDFFYWKFID